jgi:hypothetical protein
MWLLGPWLQALAWGTCSGCLIFQGKIILGRRHFEELQYPPGWRPAFPTATFLTSKNKKLSKLLPCQQPVRPGTVERAGPTGRAAQMQ